MAALGRRDGRRGVGGAAAGAGAIGALVPQGLDPKYMAVGLDLADYGEAPSTSIVNKLALDAYAQTAAAATAALSAVVDANETARDEAIADAKVISDQEIADAKAIADQLHDDMADAIAEEEERAQTAEGQLTGMIINETERASGAEEALAADIAAEEERASGAEEALASDLGDEITRAGMAE